MALNAMVKRHLATPTNVIEEFELVVLAKLYPTLMKHYNRYRMDEESWQVGKGEAKKAKILESKIFDRLVPGKVNMMLKNETSIQPWGHPGPKKARAIQYTVNERTAYEYGPQQWAFSKALIATTETTYVINDVEFTTVYTAGMDHHQIGKFASDSERERLRWAQSWIDERDGKNWDANVQFVHRCALVDLYKKLEPSLGKLTEDMVCVKGRWQNYHWQGFELIYQVWGTVKSGHWDTSCGNGALNIEVSVQAILRLPLKLRPRKVRAMVMGDDYIAWLYFDHPVDPVALRDALDAAESSFGIHPERGLFASVMHASYISLGFCYKTDGTVCATPKIGRMFAKLFSTVTPLRNRDPRRMAATIASAFLPVFNGYPPMREFLLYHLQVPPYDHETLQEMRSQFAPSLGQLALYENIDWVRTIAEKYGEEVLGLELHFERNGQQQAAWARHPLIDLMIHIDTCDPGKRRGCASL